MKQFFEKYWILIAIVVLFVLLRLLVLHHDAVPYWDAAIYIGMGKYLFSHGAIGTWEILRPVGLPIILGAFWKLGFNPNTIGTIFSLGISSGLLVLVYFIAEEIRAGAGEIAAILLASTSVFFTYSAIPITDITSSFFAVLAVWLVYKGQKNSQYLLAGLVAAVAFMFRFPQGLVLVIALIIVLIKLFQYKKGKWHDRIVAMIQRGALVVAGFASIVIPFLFVNYYFYGNAFLPFIEGTRGIQNYPSLYHLGIWYYFSQLLMQDVVFIFALLPIAMLWQKQYRSKLVITITIAFAVIGSYFIFYQMHKEIRYVLAFLPYLAVLAAVGVMYVLEWTKMPRKLFFGLFLIIGFMVSIGSLVYAKQDFNAPTFYTFNTYFEHVPQAHILTTTPYALAYSDVLITHNLYADWNAAYSDYNAFRSINDYITLDSCNLELGCADDAHCKDDKQLLLNELNKQDTKVYFAVTPVSQCQLLIYKINK
jgi:4-amino-4-deoxy-L-arabinose transferase-like glycosyltransferase